MCWIANGPTALKWDLFFAGENEFWTISTQVAFQIWVIWFRPHIFHSIEFTGKINTPSLNYIFLFKWDIWVENADPQLIFQYKKVFFILSNSSPHIEVGRDHELAFSPTSNTFQFSYHFHNLIFSENQITITSNTSNDPVFDSNTFKFSYYSCEMTCDT